MLYNSAVLLLSMVNEPVSRVSYLYGLRFRAQQVNKLGFHFYDCVALMRALHFTAKELCGEPH